MSYKQVRDVLKRVEEFHRQLAKAYGRLSVQADDGRLQLLLDYMARHERNIKSTLQAQEDSDSGVLDAWLQFTPDDELQVTLDELHIHDDMTAEEIIESALRFDRALVDLYRQLAESAGASRVQELFESLVALEEGKDTSYSRILNEMKDA